MYTKCGGVAAYRVVCIGFMLVERPSVCVLASTVLKLNDLTTCTVQIQS